VAFIKCLRLAVVNEEIQAAYAKEMFERPIKSYRVERKTPPPRVREMVILGSPAYDAWKTRVLNDLAARRRPGKGVLPNHKADELISGTRNFEDAVTHTRTTIRQRRERGSMISITRFRGVSKLN